MLVNKDELKKNLESSIERNVTTHGIQRQVSVELFNSYNIPIRLSSEILGFTKDIDELGSKGVFVAFCILKIIDEGKVNKIFTDIEIKSFSEEKYPDDKISLPLRIKCLEVAEDQWIGTITAQQLVSFGRSDLIRYEADTQRVMKRIVRGENIFFKISLVKKSVKAIEDLLNKKKYVPNTITLNIPLGEGNFFYDGESSELVIKEIEAFNIIDGYHRYRAISNLVNEDENFDYGLELRITNFDIDKANSFIWQEDQKNRMSRVDSESYNPNNLVNRIVKRLNDHSSSLLNGMIYRNGGIIDPADLAPCIQYLYLKEKIENEPQALVQISTAIMRKLNEAIESDYSIIQKKLEFSDVSILMYLVHSDVDSVEIPNRYYVIKGKIEKRKFYNKTFGKRLYDYIKGIDEGE